ncbi:acyl-CoA thioesterase [Aeromicrobium yanjiei]|uniref:Acyl-CoA thioesterase II n=1 Tax=Aeromicrobium yanjiei TaxID=2662028 RepID=A0A5Q2MKM1_9ACTN|nr:acyl-CoA thioesterase domain-containing protein [Aeromicrobium yanjiei]QGG41616.1 acyl-CoA thioesterase II [Aeromicrobium yanjiei]
MTTPGIVGPTTDDRTLLEMLELETIDTNVFRANFVFPDHYALYGGQVAAQALRAAGLTAEGRLPHSLHGYFLRPGDASRPMLLKVYRDRDGRSFSARRVVALQEGEVIFNMSASFSTPADGDDRQIAQLPDVSAPDENRVYTIPRLFSFEGRKAEQALPGLEYPIRFWARCTAPLGTDPLLNACALTYLSDISSGTAAFNTPTHATSSSLDHAMWFHRPIIANDWLLVDLVPHTLAAGRGWYTGSIFHSDGSLVASLTQEALFRRRH